MLACNYALDELSGIEVRGLPPFGLKKQMVLIHEGGRSMEPTTDWQVEPDIVLLQWNLLIERLSVSLSKEKARGLL